MELVSLTDRVAYIGYFTNIGVIINGNNCILIDSGIDARVAKEILKLLTRESLKPVAIINTHCHADHCGGNRYIKEKGGALIAVPRPERGLMENTYLEPLGFFAGAAPLKDLVNKFLMAESVPVDLEIAQQAGEFLLAGIKLKTVPLPGHSIGQIGIAADDILFCGDALFPERVLRKYKIPFFINLPKARDSLNLLYTSKYRIYLASHAQPTTRIKEMVRINLSTIEGIEQNILEIVTASKSTEQVCREIFQRYDIKITGVQQYYLLKTSILAYLSDLYNREQIEIRFRDNLPYWELAKKSEKVRGSDA